MDCGLNLSFTTYPSTQFSQQKLKIVHQSTTKSNEDSNVNHILNNQPTQHQYDNLEKNSSKEKENIRSKGTDKKQHSQILKEFYQDATINKNEPNQWSNAQDEVSEYLSHASQSFTPGNIEKQNISRSKNFKTKRRLNIIVGSTAPVLTSIVPLNDERHSTIQKIMSNSRNQRLSYSTKINYEQIKSKSTTALFHCSNQKQIRAHINRSVIERQHPIYLTMSQEKDATQKAMSLNIPRSKVNNHSFELDKRSTRSFHSSKQCFGIFLTKSLVLLIPKMRLALSSCRSHHHLYELFVY